MVCAGSHGIASAECHVYFVSASDTDWFAVQHDEFAPAGVFGGVVEAGHLFVSMMMRLIAAWG